MRLVACVLMMAWCLGLTGCAVFGKKSGTGDGPSRNEKSPAKSDDPKNDPILGPNAANRSVHTQPPPSAYSGAILAGRVVDPSEHAPGNAVIRWVSLEDNQEAAAPTDVTVNPDGYFTIQGLKIGVQYKLMARAKNGERMLAGIAYTAAPNIRVLIQVREEFANSETPPLLGSPAFPKNATSNAAPKQGWTPLTGSIGNLQVAPLPAVNPAMGSRALPGQEPDLPVQMKVPMPDQSVQAAPAWVPGPETKPNWPPTLEIPGARPKPLPLPAPSAEPPPPMYPGTTGPQGTGPARVPSCVYVGQQLVNFALSDVSGQPWELKSQRRGKLVLLDFWATFCVPCQKSMPKLRDLQNRFGAQGLEVIGIAYEDGGSSREQAQRVHAMCQSKQINYRQLLGAGPGCPVKTQLNIKYVPTLILLDENGIVVWRTEGLPDRAGFEELERLIQRRLQPF